MHKYHFVRLDFFVEIFWDIGAVNNSRDSLIGRHAGGDHLFIKAASNPRWRVGGIASH